MELNDRKIKILEAIITDYISTGEPIGSRTIARKYNLGVSSATIRNEMSDLEELGLIEQPHASAGRVPSDRGYRLYVDKFMTQWELSKEEKLFLENIVSSNINQIDYLMEETAKALSLLTSYATVVSKPQVERDKIKHISIMPFDKNSSLITLVTENKVIKNFEAPMRKELSSQDIININQELANILENYDFKKLNNIKDLEDLNIIYNSQDVNNILKCSISCLEENGDTKIFTSGINNILGFKEFNDIEKAKNLFSTLEEKDILINILGNGITNINQEFNNTSINNSSINNSSINNSSINNSSIEILIGDEHHIKAIKECSIVKTEYKIAGATGTIGIIAPTRMDYAKTVSILENIIQNINNILTEKRLK